MKITCFDTPDAIEIKTQGFDMMTFWLSDRHLVSKWHRLAAGSVFYYTFTPTFIYLLCTCALSSVIKDFAVYFTHELQH